MIKVILCGALGRMGRVVAQEIAGDGELDLVGAVEAPGHPGLGSSVSGVDVTSDLKNLLPSGDVVVDFTNPKAALAHILESSKGAIPVIVGTTGLSPEQIEEAKRFAGKIPVLLSPNMSLGVNLMFKLAENAAIALADFDVEIVEIHHNRKKDSPSGTAARIADVIKGVRPDTRLVHGREGFIGERKRQEIGMHSLRGGDVVGEHTVIFAGEGERFELTHRAHSRRTFARGTMRAIRFILGREPGLYSMNDVLGFE